MSGFKDVKKNLGKFAKEYGKMQTTRYHEGQKRIARYPSTALIRGMAAHGEKTYGIRNKYISNKKKND